MASINFAALMGVIKGDVRHTTTKNSEVANFTLVTKAKAHPNAKVDYFQTYHNITAWGRMAEDVKDCAEGDMVQVEGHIENESWDDPNDGKKRYKTVIKARNLNVIEEERPRRNPIEQPADAPDAPF